MTRETVIALSIALALAGCGGCGREEPPATAAGGEARAEAAPAAVPLTVEDLQPVIREVAEAGGAPTRIVELSAAIENG